MGPATADSRVATWTGTWTMVHLAWRRDRRRLPIWIVGVSGFVVFSAVALGDVVPDAAARAARAQLMASPTLRALRGPGYGLADYSYGAMVAHELLLFGAIGVALMSILTVTRHTRAEEESGRSELLRAGVLGRHAATAAALSIAVAASLTVGTLTAVGLVGTVAELDLVGSLVMGLSLAVTGMVFAAVALVAVQLVEYARAANGSAGIVLAASFVVRAVGDSGGPDHRAVSWLSPLGWVQSTRPFVDERLWPLGLALAFVVAAVVIALAMVDRRDLGAGSMPPRPGPATAAEWLVSPAGLAWRLHRGALLGWTMGAVGLGVSFGAVIGDIGIFLAQNPHLEDIFGAGGGRLLDAFLATITLLVALLAVGFALQVAGRVQLEETEGRAEPLLATSLSRRRWLGGHLVVGLGGAAVIAVAGGLALGTAAAIDQRDGSFVPELLLAGLAHVPAAWVTFGVVIAILGWLPRASGIGWLLLAYATFVGLFAEVVGLPGTARGVSPHHHVPELPAASIDAVGPTILAAVAALAIAVGVAGLTRRDLHTA